MAVWNDECRPWLGRLALLGEAQRADDEGLEHRAALLVEQVHLPSRYQTPNPTLGMGSSVRKSHSTNLNIDPRVYT